MKATHSEAGGPSHNGGLDDALRFLGRGTAIRAGGTIISAASGLATTALAVRLLDPGPYGSLAVGLASTVLFAGLARLGLGLATTRSLSAAHAAADPMETRSLISGATTVTFFGSLLGSLAVAALLLVTQGDLEVGERAVLAVAMGMLLFGRNASLNTFSVARGLSAVSWMEIPGVVTAIAILASISTLWLTGGAALSGISSTYAVGGFVGVATSVLVLKRIAGPGGTPLAINASAARKLVRLAGPYVVAGVATSAIAQFDVLVLGFTRTPEEVAGYEPLLRLTDRAFNLVPLLFLAAFVPAATGLYVAGQRETFAQLLRTASRYSFALALPAMLLLTVFPDTVARALYGYAFGVDRELVAILLVGYIPHVAFGLNLGALTATGKRDAILWAYGTSLSVMVVAAALLIPAFGPWGAAVATAAAYLALNVSSSVWLYRVSGAHIFHRSTIVLWTTSAVAWGIAASLRPVLTDEPTLASAVGIVLLAWALWAGLQFALRTTSVAEIRTFAPGTTGPRSTPPRKK